jgi:hypothetical protein
MSLHRALPSAWVALVAVLCAVTSCKAPVVEEIDHFPLRGAHVEVSCSACHGESLANATPTTCAGCHEGTRPANHYEGDCQDCHNEISWEGAVADHGFFPLERRARRIRAAVKAASLGPSTARRVSGLLHRQLRLIRGLELSHVARRMLRYWHLFHRPLAGAMYVIVLVHVAGAVLFGGSLHKLASLWTEVPP